MKDQKRGPTSSAPSVDDCWFAPRPGSQISRDSQNQGLPLKANGQHPEEHMQWLVKTIEAEIIPRLMAAHRDDPKRNIDDGSCSITAQDVLEFSDSA